MKLLLGQDLAVADWVARRIPHMAPAIAEAPYGLAFGPAAAIGVLSEPRDGSFGRLLGGVVYHNYQPHYGSIELSSASDEGGRWLSPPLVRALLRYPLEQLHCQRLTCVTPRKSDQPRKFLERLGFKREGVARCGFGNDHAIIYGLLRKEWDKHPLNRPRATRQGALTDGQISPQAAASA